METAWALGYLLHCIRLYPSRRFERRQYSPWGCWRAPRNDLSVQMKCCWVMMPREPTDAPAATPWAARCRRARPLGEATWLQTEPPGDRWAAEYDKVQGDDGTSPPWRCRPEEQA